MAHREPMGREPPGHGGIPDMQQQRRWLHGEGRRAVRPQVERDRVRGARADGGGTAGKGGEHRPVDVATHSGEHLRMASQNLLQSLGAVAILQVHVPNAGRERGMMKRHERRP